MLYIISFFVLSILNPSGVFSQNGTLPFIHFDTLSYDYGTIERHGAGMAEIRFKKTGNQALIIEEVLLSCGFKGVEWQKTPVMGGEHGYIQTKYDTRRLGAINKDVSVISNAQNGLAKIQLKGNVIHGSQQFSRGKK